MKLLTINQASELCGLSKWQYEKYKKIGICPLPIATKNGTNACLYSEKEILDNMGKINAYREKLAHSGGKQTDAVYKKAFDKIINAHADKVFSVFNKIVRSE